MTHEESRPRVFIHVGSPKTGTTFLQNVLWSQASIAVQQGLLLPGERFFHHYLATLDVRGHAGRKSSPAETKGMWARLVSECRAWEGTSLISHELFAPTTATQAADAVAAFGPEAEVHIVLTARDLARQIPAEWQEHVKHRSSTTLAEFTTDLRNDTDRTSWFWQVQDYPAVVRRWSAGIPTDRVHVVTVPRTGAPPGLLWDRFAGLLSLDPSTFDTTSGRGNTSLGYEQAEMLRQLNSRLGDRLPLPGPYPSVVKSLLAERIMSGHTGSRLVLDRATSEFAIDTSRAMVGELRELGVDVVGDLEELVPDPEATLANAVDDYPVPSTADLWDEAMASMIELLQAHHRLQLQRKALLATLAEEREESARFRRAAQDRPLRFAMLRAAETRPGLERVRRVYQRDTSAADASSPTDATDHEPADTSDEDSANL